MRASHEEATVPAGPGSAFETPVDPWLRMRLAPVPAHRRPPGRATVRDALHAIAGARPDPAMLAVELCSCAPCSIGSASGSGRRLRAGASGDEAARAEAQLLDGTVIGLCHLGRQLEPRAAAGVVPPLAVIACGAYGRRRLVPGASADLRSWFWPIRSGASRGLRSRASWHASWPASAGRRPPPSARCAAVCPKSTWTRRSWRASLPRAWSGAAAACSPSCGPGWARLCRPEAPGPLRARRLAPA